MLSNQHLNNEWANSVSVQRKIEQAVNRCIRRGAIAPAQKDDAMQDLRLQMLEGRWRLLCEKYDPGRASFEHYLSYRLYSDCLNLSRKKAYTPPQIADTEMLGGYSSVAYPLLEELKTQLLETLEVLKLDSPGYRLLFKAYVGKPLLMSDLKAYAPKVNQSQIRHYHRLFEQPYALRHKAENLELLLPLFREAEGKKLQPEALHKLINRKLFKLREYLSKHSSYPFDNESVSNLLYVVL